MVTEFEIMDARGNPIANGEIDNGIYRVFSNENPSECEEFKNLPEMLKAWDGIAIQPMIFDTPARTRQLTLLRGTPTK